MAVDYWGFYEIINAIFGDFDFSYFLELLLNRKSVLLNVFFIFCENSQKHHRIYLLDFFRVHHMSQDLNKKQKLGSFHRFWDMKEKEFYTISHFYFSKCIPFHLPKNLFNDSFVCFSVIWNVTKNVFSSEYSCIF